MGTFQRSITVLYAIGLNMYLGLEVDAPHILTQYPVSNTLDTVIIHLSFLYGAFTLYGILFQETLSFQERIKTVAPHLLYVSIKDSVCPRLCSVALTNSISIDFFSCRY